MIPIQNKPFWRSKTFYGAIATLILAMIHSMGGEVPYTDEQLSDALMRLAIVISTIWTLYGRAKAEEPLTLS